MFRKLHRQMTIFSTLVTSGILILMTITCLIISEQGLVRNSYERFWNNGNSCVAYLENQNVLTYQWILESRQEYGVEISILDNGRKLYFEKLDQANVSESQKRSQNMLETAARISKEEQGLDVEYNGNLALSREAFFKTGDFYACTALIPKENGVLSLVMVHSLDGLKNQIFHQRVLFGILVAVAVAVLWGFAWLFTGKMLGPLEENRKRQTQFIAAASHELRSPLAVILSCVQAMETDPGESRKFMQTIKSEGNRMSRLVGDMLALANADNKSWSILKSPCELDTLILDTYEKYEPLLREKKISIEAVLPEEVLSPCKCDSSRISQVLGILLDNSASYVPAGGKVWIGVEEKEKYFKLYVKDNGPGIPDERKESVFLRFYRADSSRKDKQHFGLGLCIAKEIVTLHHGSIKVEDTVGGGSTFVIRLPKV